MNAQLPTYLQTEIYAELPEDLRLAQRSSTWAARQPNIGPIHSLLEGPCFTRDARFYCVDVAHGRIFEIVKGEFHVVAEYDGEPNGLCAHKDGRIFVADHRNGIVIFDIDKGTVTPLLEQFENKPFLGVNDLTFADNGDLYFTDQGLSGMHEPNGRVFRLSADGHLSILLDNIPSPNGLALNRQQNELYLCVTRDNSIWRLPLLANGGVSKVGRFIQMSGGVGPDGMAIDSTGNIFVAHIGLGCVWAFNPQGEAILRINSCAGLGVTNIAFGGSESKTLFITEAESGCVLMTKLETGGHALFSHH